MEASKARESLAQYGRGVVGGLLFALPLLYTVEMWHLGLVASPLRLLAGLVGAFGLLLAYNRYAGLREDATFREVLIDSVEETGLGLLIAVAVLGLTGRLSEGDQPTALVGKVVVCGLMAAIGVAVGSAQLGTDDPQGKQGEEDEAKDAKDVHVGEQILIGLCGAVLIAGNVAPTEEVQRMAYETTPAMLLGLLAISLGLTATIAGVAEIRGGRSWGARIAVPDPIFAAVATNAVGIVASVGMLAFFDALKGNGLEANLSQIMIVGFPAALGASAGRLLLQS